MPATPAAMAPTPPAATSSSRPTTRAVTSDEPAPDHSFCRGDLAVKRKNLLLWAFGGAITVFVFVLFIVQGYSYLEWNHGKPLTTLEPQGQYSRAIHGLEIPVFGIAAVVF